MKQSSIFKELVVIELANALAGPSTGMFFAELGAKVIKVENKRKGGDVTRRWKHPSEDKSNPYSAYYYSINWHKEVMMLDLTSTQDQALVHGLVKDADIVLVNFKPGSSTKLRMDYATLSSINDKIIYGSISAYGDDDPRPGFDALMQAETGWMSMNGETEGPPTKFPLPMIDILASHQLKQGILVSLYQRKETGKGAKISVSLYDASVAALANQASTFLNLDKTPERMGSRHPSIAPYGDIITTSDQVDYLLAVGTEKHFQALLKVFNLTDLAADSRFSDNQLRLKNRTSLVQILQSASRQLTSEEFEKSCDNHGVPVGPVRDLSQVFSDDHAKRLILEESINNESTLRVKTAIFKIA